MFTTQAARSAALVTFLVVGCKTEEAPSQRVAPPEAPTLLELATEKAVDPGKSKILFIAPTGRATFLIDAPLEKIKGEARVLRGRITGNPKDLAKTYGQLDVDLTSLTLDTFEDASKNKTQTEHAHNWLELGADVPSKQRLENQWVRFTLQSLAVSPSDLNDVPETDGQRVVQGMAQGKLWLHGKSVPKQVKVQLAFTGPADAPTRVALTTVEPLTLSLQEHDVKPRDLAGKFLQGALEKVGEKIVDVVQISVSAEGAVEGAPDKAGAPVSVE